MTTVKAIQQECKHQTGRRRERTHSEYISPRNITVASRRFKHLELLPELSCLTDNQINCL